MPAQVKQGPEQVLLLRSVREQKEASLVGAPPEMAQARPWGWPERVPPELANRPAPLRRESQALLPVPEQHHHPSHMP
jgi:hypothetical protein